MGAAAALLMGCCGAADAAPDAAKPATGEWVAFKVVGDGIPQPLGAAAGDVARGRALIVAREDANCVLCHAISDPGVRFSGNVGPSLDGVGRRLSTAQLRLAIVDSLRLHPSTIMPSYYRIDGLDRVASAYRGKPILDAQQVDDIVAYLATLR
jgi:sulfur-oxidizing protein SoxX